MDYGFTLDSQFEYGLRPDKNAKGAISFAGMRPKKGIGGVTPAVIQLLAPTLDDEPVVGMDWPFPQVVQMRHGALYAVRGAVYELNGLELSEIDTDADISHNGVWHVADLGGTWYAFNGEGVLAKKRKSEKEEGETDYGWEYVWTEGTYISGCAVNESRLFMSYTSQGIPWVTYTRTRMPNVHMPLPLDGEKAYLYTLGENVICYGENGACALKPGVADGSVHYGSWPLYGVGGVANRSSVAVMAEDYHIVLDKDGVLWRIGADLLVTQLGYSEFLASVTTPVLSADTLNREVWINSHVLTEQPDGPNGHALGGPAARMQNGFYCYGGKLYSTDADTSPTTVTFHSGLQDMGYRGAKTTQTINITSDGIERLAVQIYGRNNSAETVTVRSKRVSCTPHGTCFPIASFVDGKVVISGTVSGTESRLSGAEVRYQRNDRRFRRGPIGIPETD